MPERRGQRAELDTESEGLGDECPFPHHAVFDSPECHLFIGDVTSGRGYPAKVPFMCAFQPDSGGHPVTLADQLENGDMEVREGGDHGGDVGPNRIRSEGILTDSVRRMNELVNCAVQARVPRLVDEAGDDGF